MSTASRHRLLLNGRNDNCNVETVSNISVVTRDGRHWGMIDDLVLPRTVWECEQSDVDWGRPTIRHVRLEGRVVAGLDRESVMPHVGLGVL